MTAKLFPSSMYRVLDSTKDVLTTVGIIMRTKDRPILLSRAFSSVLNQKYTDWHLYLVNDSGDQSALNDLVYDYKSAFGRRITVINKDVSTGMEAASNEGLRFVTADKCGFVVIHDDDDSWHPDFLKETVAFLKKTENRGYAAVATMKTLIYERIHNQLVFEENRAEGFVPSRIDMASLLERNFMPPICLLIRMSVVDTIGTFNEKLPVLGDWDYNIRILMIGDIGVIARKLAFYHHRNSSADVYGNSVIQGVNKHDTYTNLYSNSMLRHLLQINPGYAGLIHVMMNGFTKVADAMHSRVNEVDKSLKDTKQALVERAEHMHYLEVLLKDLIVEVKKNNDRKPWYKRLFKNL